MKRPAPPGAKSALAPNLGFGERCAKRYDAAAKLTSKFFGREHLEALVEALGTMDLPLLLTQLQKHLETKIIDSKAYVDGIKEGLPPIKLPSYTFRAGGCYGFFELKLKPFLEYDDLKPEVFQIFREIGNMVAFFRDLSDVIDVNNATQYVATAPLFGARCGFPVPKPEDSPWSNTVHAFLASLGNDSTDAGAGGGGGGGVPCRVPDIQRCLKGNTARAHWLYASSLESSSVVTKVLAKIDRLLTSSGIRDDWSGSLPSNGVLEVEHTTEFYRLWSALIFLYSMKEKPSAHEVANGLIPVPDEKEFGHGFLLAGAMFIHMLGMTARFNVMDFSAHMLRVANHEKNQPAPETGSVAMKIGMVDAVSNQAYVAL